jgi:very-short-patch-repair endonuclease
MPGTEKARALRRKATGAEQRLWRHLRDRRLCGYKFRRQQSIGRYIVDFICKEQGLVVELDGRQHAEQEDYDKAWTARLEACGFQVIRFANYDALKNTDEVLSRILRTLESIDRQTP